MRVCIVLFFALFAFVSCGDSYDTKYDNFDIDTLLDNQRILKNYVKCFMDKGPCTPEGKYLRSILPEVIQTNCKKCNPKQKTMIRKVTRHLRDKKPSDWKDVTRKYDKDSKFVDSFEKFMDSTD